MEEKVLFNLLSIPAISGREEKIISFLKEEMKRLKLNYEIDNLGSLWAVKKTENKNAKTVMIDAHVDEVGFNVTKIEENGFICFEAQGGIFSKSVIFQRLKVWTSNLKKGYVGTVVTPELDLTSYESLVRVQKFQIDKMFLDVGFSSKKEAQEAGIKIGNVITFATKPVINKNHLISKAIDNRLGTYIVYDLLDFVSRNTFDYNIVIGFSVQEEVGLRGSRVSTYKYNPDIGIVVDISPANDYNADINGSLGKGTILRHKDGMTVYPKVITHYLKKVIDKNNIKYQDYFSAGGTNAGIMHVTCEGKPVFPIGFLARNLHTASSVCDLRDLEETQKLIKALLKDLNNSKISDIKQLGRK
ncbi:MAG: glutamyl aminopeptidase [Candidatus Hepatoplasma vulgare]|nr:MAG: glutamyl aminopeptidase [Candidatus Hepatoplasma sp.]